MDVSLFSHFLIFLFSSFPVGGKQQKCETIELWPIPLLPFIAPILLVCIFIIDYRWSQDLINLFLMGHVALCLWNLFKFIQQTARTLSVWSKARGPFQLHTRYVRSSNHSPRSAGGLRGITRYLILCPVRSDTVDVCTP